jgi:hypothetical protein
MRRALISLAVAAILSVATVARADDAHPWDATWAGGFDNGGDGVQVIVAGDAVIGFFLGADYVDVSDSAPIAADGSLTFTWDGGSATLAVDGDKHTLTIHQAGAADRVIDLTRDQ